MLWHRFDKFFVYGQEERIIVQLHSAPIDADFAPCQIPVANYLIGRQYISHWTHTYSIPWQLN